MAITINHGNIAAALGIAAAAGTAQRDKTISDQDLQFMGLMQNAQGEADRNYANQIGLALQGGEDQSKNALAANQQGIEQQHYGAQQATANRQFGFEQQQLASLNQNRALQNDARQQGLGIRQDQQGTRQDAQDLRQQQYGDKQDAIGQLDPNLQAVVTATGRLPWEPSNIGADPASKAAMDEARMVGTELKQAAESAKAAAYDPRDAIGPHGKASQSVPGAAAGMEPQYQAAVQQMTALHARQQALNARIQQSNDALAADPGAVQRRNQQAYYAGLTAHGSQPANPGTSPARSDTGGGSGSTPTISSAAEYEALPPGSKYIWNGVQYTKPAR